MVVSNWGRVQRLEWAAAVALVVVHLPFLFIYYSWLWRLQVHYQFFPFALAAFAYFYLRRGNRKACLEWRWEAKGLIALDLVCLGLGVASGSPWFFALGGALGAAGLGAATQDFGYSRCLTYLAILPLLTVRLPVNGDVQLIQSLQSATTSVASRVLQRAGYLHVRTGNVLEFPGKRFFIEEACSGVQSLFTMLFIAAFVICTRRRSFVHGAMLLVTAVLAAGVMNVMRVAAIAVAWEDYGRDLSTGFVHDVLGYICLAAAGLLLVSGDAFLSFFTNPIPDNLPDISRPWHVAELKNPFIALWNWVMCVVPKGKRSEDGEPRAAASPRRRSGWGWSVATMALCGVLLLFQGYALSGGVAAGPVRKLASDSNRLRAETLPEHLASYLRKDYEVERRPASSDFGEYSSHWTYSGSGLAARVSCDHPFTDWHDLRICYSNQGWKVEEATAQDNGDDWQAVSVRMFHPTRSQHGILVFSAFDAAGNPVAPQGFGSTGERALDRLFHKQKVQWNRPEVYQAQVLTATAVREGAERVEELLKMHFATREKLRSEISGGGESR